MAGTSKVGRLPKVGSYDECVVTNPKDGLGVPIKDCTPRELGPYGKELAVAYLFKRGLVVVDRDWVVRGDSKVDLVAIDGNCPVLVEVRTCLYDESPKRPRDVNVDNRRRRRLEFQLLMWLAKHARYNEARYDVLSVRVEDGHTAHVCHLVGACVHRAR